MEAKSSAEMQAKEKNDLVAMTASQEQSKAILDGLRQKLSAQVADKQKELEKLQEEKDVAEKERDDALYSNQALQSDLDRIQK